MALGSPIIMRSNGRREEVDVCDGESDCSDYEELEDAHVLRQSQYGWRHARQWWLITSRVGSRGSSRSDEAQAQIYRRDPGRPFQAHIYHEVQLCGRAATISLRVR